jgi:hypothetical protein
MYSSCLSKTTFINPSISDLEFSNVDIGLMSYLYSNILGVPFLNEIALATT